MGSLRNRSPRLFRRCVLAPLIQATAATRGQKPKQKPGKGAAQEYECKRCEDCYISQHSHRLHVLRERLIDFTRTFTTGDARLEEAEGAHGVALGREFGDGGVDPLARERVDRNSLHDLPAAVDTAHRER